MLDGCNYGGTTKKKIHSNTAQVGDISKIQKAFQLLNNQTPGN